MFEALLFRFFRHSILYRLAVIALFFIFTAGAIIHWLEPNQFKTIFDGIWWSVVTIATVGYGDFAPETIAGRVIGIILILLGCGFISTYFFTLSSIVVAKENAYMEGTLSYKGTKHYVIIGWNERTKQFIDHFKIDKGEHRIVLIDNSLTENPMVCENVYFVKGNPTYTSVLEKANIAGADKVLITSDPFKAEALADMQSILILIAIKGINPSIHSIIEILTSEQVVNAKHAGANKVINTNQLISNVMYDTFFSTP
ncbi:potassium channel family protein [Priestia koreensis]|uniref:potassium channel family protein n=1 Tax=Priestia koreensis TaxID=284581 RepID=UPI001F5A3116|nr:potassium channel family protein [Priestia koreensis]MCM3004392.1 potassium channel family protein [Priestia koreensis]UNL84609.1 potassium channel protein [Priestia koreensis]